MTANKRTEITIETDQILIIRRRRSARLWCQECGSQVEMVDLGQAEALTGVSEPRLRDRAGGGKWHVHEGQDGALLVCLESLFR